MSNPNIYVGPVNFESFSGEQFERLVFAYHLRAEWWHTLEWYGQVGSDSGRDIWGSFTQEFQPPKTICIQCANRKTLTAAKAREDIEKIAASPNGIPSKLRFVASSNISASLRDAIHAHAKTHSIDQSEVWSGQEFEEYLHKNAESLLARFCRGVAVPDTRLELDEFVRDLPAANDQEILGHLARIFDRPAFTTRFYDESDVGDFRKAIADTIETMNTGVCRTRDKEFKKIHCRHDIGDAHTKQALNTIVESLNHLRVQYDTFERNGQIRKCGNASHLHIDAGVGDQIDEMRREILELFRSIYPEFSVRLFGT